MDDQTLSALRAPTLRLHGPVDDSWIDRFVDAAATADARAPFCLEVTTTGGDAEVGRRLALEVGLMRQGGRRMLFLGKTIVYSAGATIMGGFRREERWLTDDCCVLIHERQLTRDLHLDGPMRACRQQVAKLASEIEAGLDLEREGFTALAEGSALSADDVAARARDNWYLTAREARDHGMIAGVFGG